MKEHPTIDIPYIDAESVARDLPPAAAVQAIEKALHSGLEPANDPPRHVKDIRGGQFLIMPSDSGSAAGVKLATIAPRNPSLGLPRIQGVYVHFDALTLAPAAIIDGPALTTLRTPAVSIAAVRSYLHRASASLNIVVFGAGPQAIAHVNTLVSIAESLPEIRNVTHVLRTLRALPAYSVGETEVVLAGTSEADAAVRRADVIICATSAQVPLFDSRKIRENAIVIAVGSHERNVREVDGDLCGRAAVIVEDLGTALRECGDIVLAINEDKLDPNALIPLTEVFQGSRKIPAGRPILFKSSGMAWEDLVIAEALLEKRRARSTQAMALMPYLPDA